MALTAGAKLGPYEILSRAGAGGMGEVYKARDTRLQRTVAIKVLPPDRTSDPSAKQRLEREARAVAALSHPNICPLFDIGHQDGTDYLVMEFLEGETLAQRLTKGKLPVEQALQCGIQIAEGLAAAHKAGIIHRDLKPGNIVLTKSGAKLLDFGLAKPRVEIAGSGLTQVATQEPLTGEGTLIGTLQYMAPEQVQGGAVDARTDIFALGAILYEIATGRRAFDATTQAGLIAKILETDVPAVSTRVPAAPPFLDEVLHGCLAKDPADRWQAAHDVTLQLRWLQRNGSSTKGVASPSALRRVSQWIPWVIATLAVAALVGSALPRSAPLASPAGVLAQFETILPDDMDADPSLGDVVISPDGHRTVFSASLKGQTQLFLRDLASAEVVPLEDTENAFFPFWSPDSRAIGFFAGGKVKRIPASGGPATLLADATGWHRRLTGGGTWANGTILFALGNGSVVRVPDSGGVPTPIESLPRAIAQTAFFSPRLLPDGRHFLISRRGDPALYVASIDTPGLQRIDDFASRPVYAAKRLFFFRGSNVFARPFDAQRLMFTGPERLLVTGASDFAASDNGTVVYRRAHVGVSRVTWMDRDGRREDTLIEPGAYTQVVLSPRRRHAALVRMRGEEPSVSNLHLWDVDLATGVFSRVATEPASDPSWSPDERRIAFTSSMGVSVKDLTTGAQEPFAVWKDRPLVVDQWTPDGKFIIARNAGQSVWAIPVNGERTPQLLIDTPFVKDEVHVSPDGRWVAYNADESGRWEVYIAQFPTFTSKRQISNGGGVQPQWNGDGRELFYLAGDGAMMSIRLTPTPEAPGSPPSRLFATRIRPTAAQPQYAVNPDGQRFLALEPVERERKSLHFLLNGFEASTTGSSPQP